MGTKKWLYAVELLDELNPEEKYVDFLRYQFEVEGISPYKFVAGPYSKFMKSEDYDEINDPTAIEHFIKWIGDKNTLTVKKLRDPATDDLREMNQKNEAYHKVKLLIAPASTVYSSGSNANSNSHARLINIGTVATGRAYLLNATPTYMWTINSKDNNETIIYDYVTFEAKDVKFRFSWENSK